MKPEDLITNLRDIHLPPTEQQSLLSDMVWWPLAVFALILLLWLSGIWRRRNAWRREVKSTLDQIDDAAAAGRLEAAWQQLAHLLKRIAIKVRPAPGLAGSDGEQWLRQLDAIFNTREFETGPGRGLIHYPYLRRVDASANDIRALTALVRRRITTLKSPG